MIKKALVVLLAVAAVSIGLGVRDAEARGSSYGAAGCGLGSLAWGDKASDNDSIAYQVLAATTNGTFWSQTFGISFGTSNCDTGKGGRASLDVYIEANEVALASDIARGSGETLAGLSQLLRCSDTVALGSTLRENYGTIYPTHEVDSQAVGQSIVETVQRDPNLSSTCQI